MQRKIHELDWVNKVVNGILILELFVHSDIRNQNRLYFECKCHCGNIFTCRAENVVKEKTKSCGCRKQLIGHKVGKASHNWKGCGDIPGHYFACIKVRSKKHQTVFDLTIEDLWLLFQEQNGKCAISGRPLTFQESRRVPSGTETTASLDRIDSSKGYVTGNIQWVHKDINLMKNHFDSDYFIKTCQEIAKFAQEASLP